VVEEGGRTRLPGIKVDRALAKTLTYEVVTAVSESGANYLVVRDLAAAAGLTAFSVVIAPFVYYVHEKAWDHHDANKGQSPAALACVGQPITVAAREMLPTAVKDRYAVATVLAIRVRFAPKPWSPPSPSLPMSTASTRSGRAGPGFVRTRLANSSP
jgi:uncharacterized membrane protein